MLLSDLARAIASRTPVTFSGGVRAELVRVCDVTEDSRTVVPGSLFVARSGRKADGRQFVADAVAAGAVAVLTDDPELTTDDPEVPVLRVNDVMLATAEAAEAFYGRASRSLSLIGVTGTNGKSTTTYLVWKLLNALDRRCGLIGTVMIDDGREVARAVMTTPPSTELSRTFASMAESGCVAASMEVSSHALHQQRAAALNFKVGVFTNLTGDHLDYHLTMENYADAKAQLFAGLHADALAIVNDDDPAAARMLRDCRAKALRCKVGTGPTPDGHASVEILDRSMRGMRLLLTGPWGVIESKVGLIGDYNAMNTLQAVACCWALGLSADELRAVLPELDAPPGRLERVSDDDSDLTVFVDFAHSDDALASVLQAVGRVIPGRAHAGAAVLEAAGASRAREEIGKLWVVFGCGGDKDRTKRPRMGKAAAELADVVVVTSDNPRTEKPGQIIDEILAGVPAHLRAKVCVQADRARAIKHAVEHAGPRDVIVLAGKGHETSQILSDGKGGLVSIEFDEAGIARRCLADRGGG
ncbi:MAG: UDP-N-acetylmuramoyl-L-alanyl-D-glutamate--2,6-diaminopimelate ligase [Phycisphaerales bacterium]